MEDPVEHLARELTGCAWLLFFFILAAGVALGMLTWALAKLAESHPWG